MKGFGMVLFINFRIKFLVKKHFHCQENCQKLPSPSWDRRYTEKILCRTCFKQKEVSSGNNLLIGQEHMSQ